jgi:phage recombination protein Bet
MEKAIQFTEAQKSLIWRTKVEPKHGTADDAYLFMEVCEQYGLNPLLGDIVFNRYETKSGPVVNFIVSRDGYLKAAMRDKDFVKCVSAVIKEGDDFEMDIEGNVQHKFGKQRGKIIGAWAYAEHARRGKLPVVVDFGEYFRANAQSQNGRSPIWDAMPSAMIQKVAEVASLRRQFPLGGIIAAEEMGTDDVPVNELNEKISSATNPTTSKDPSPVEKETKKTANPKSTNKGKKEKEEEKAKETNKEVSKQEEKVKAEPQTEISETEAAAESTVESQKEETVEKTADETKLSETVETNSTDSEEVPYKPYNVLAFQSGKTPQGTPFLKVAAEDENKKKVVLIASGDISSQLDEVEKGQKCLFHVENINGYETLKAFGGLAG